MSGAERIRDGLTRLSDLALQVASDHAESIAQLADRYIRTLRGGGTLFFAGNGGSAADAQHITTEYVVRYRQNRRALPALALTTDTSLLTACGNDLGFAEVFARQVEALVAPGDLLMLHSTSGESPNLLNAARAARARKAVTVALLGKGGGPLRAEVDHALVIPSDDTARIQEIHLAIEHLICEIVEEEMGTGPVA